MDERERTIIRKSRTLFVKNLEDIDGICDRLTEQNILTSSMREEVVNANTKEARIRNLLDIIPKRGKNAYNCFHEALVDTGNEELANTLRPESSGLHLLSKTPVLARSLSTPSPPQNREISYPATYSPYRSLEKKKLRSKSMENILDEVTETEKIATGWPCRSEHARPIDIIIKPSEAKLSSDVYPMTSRRRGNVVIINNYLYYKTPPSEERTKRHQIDATSLNILFRELKFNVNTYNNITLKKLSEIVGKESTADHTDDDCFIFIIMAFGRGDVIKGIEGDEMKLDNIVSCFDSEHCPSLIGKPKLFIIQACESGEPSDDPSIDLNLDRLEQDSLMSMVSTCHSAGQDYAACKAEDQRTDMMFMRATIDRTIDWNDELFGSLFIQAFVYIMKHWIHNTDICTIIEKVNMLVREGNSRHCVKQIVEYSHSLTRKLYLVNTMPDTK